MRIRKTNTCTFDKLRAGSEQGRRIRNKYSKTFFCSCLILFVIEANSIPALQKTEVPSSVLSHPSSADFESLRLAITDLIDTFGSRYLEGQQYLPHLKILEQSSKAALDRFDKGDDSANAELARLADELKNLQYEALLSNPLLDFDKLLLLKRKHGQLGLPTNHQCNTALERTGYDNEIAVLSPVRLDGRLQTLYRPKGGEFVGEIDLHFDADRLLFTMPVGQTWQIHEIKTDGTGLRQVSPGEHPDVDNFDACYLPDGRIVFVSTASYHAVPCWHGKERACSIYIMDADGSNMRQLCFDQDLDLHPAVLPTGQVIFSRWDYTGPMHMYLRPLMVMNPDGTSQRAVYGSNSYWPNALYFPRGIPGAPSKLIAIISGYHGVNRMGELGLLDLTKGWYEAEGVVQRIPGRGKPIKTVIRDKLVDESWPKFLHPYPLSDPSTGLGAGKYFIVAAQPDNKSPWGIYLVDVFDNMLPIQVHPKFDFFEPIPIKKMPKPPVIPDRVDLKRDDAIVYLHDVYVGPGLAGVPRGTIKKLRIVAYHFGYPGMAGPDNIGCGGPWEVMRIIGTVPIHEDGSAMFRVPANTPLCVQPLDKQGKAVQLMRSWFTAMPGEVLSCVGCHERPNEIPAPQGGLAAKKEPAEIAPWYGPARGFDFEREVQPVLDKYCVTCHNQQTPTMPDLRSERCVENYSGRELNYLGAKRLHPAVREALGGTKVRYTPAYEALIPYIRRVNVEDHVGLHVPGEYHADTSELIQMLAKGHHNVQLDQEAWDRLVTWIDLNGPCHGTWSEVCPIPDGARQRRRQLSQLYGGPTDDPEQVPETCLPTGKIPRPNTYIRTYVHTYIRSSVEARETSDEGRIPQVACWPFDVGEAWRRQRATEEFEGPRFAGTEKIIDLGDGVTMKLVRIPAGQFVMGDPNGEVDESASGGRTCVQIEQPFWMGACEVTNEQYHQFDPSHNSGFFNKRYQSYDGPGLLLSRPKQPAVRVSWNQAKAFCRWLSEKIGVRFDLPTEAQWEYACRAGSSTPFSYGTMEADFSQYANLADKALSVPPGPTGGLTSNITEHKGNGIFISAIYGGNIICDARFDDGNIATAEVGQYQPNAWGLYDMHGNAAEWTRTTYPVARDPSPMTPPGASRGDEPRATCHVVRGGSWCDRPKRCRSSFRLSYPSWQRVHNVGFRVICEIMR